jgi:hypothetical protein
VLAWCPACRRFVIAEEVPSVEALEEKIGRYRFAGAETLQKACPTRSQS